MTFIVFTMGNYGARAVIATKNALFNALLITAAKLFRSEAHTRYIISIIIPYNLPSCLRAFHVYIKLHNGTILKFAAEFSPII